MSWSYFSIIDENSDNDALAPVMASIDAAYPIELNESDGPNVVAFPAKSVHFYVKHDGKLIEKPKAPLNLDWTVLVTDSRVVTFCEKFDKGGGWIGIGIGAGVAAAANAVSRARAASRRKGKILAGQYRYPWLLEVSASPKVDWRTVGKLRLSARVPMNGKVAFVILEIILPTEVDALPVGNDIARRTAKFRLENDPRLKDAKSKFEEMVDESVREPDVRNHFKRNSWAVYRMPNSYEVTEETADLANIR